MAILIPLCFIVIFLSTGICVDRAGRREIILRSVLIQCLLVLVITELLSAFGLLAFTPIVISWLIVLLSLVIFLFKRRDKAKAFARNFWSDLRKSYRALRPVEKLLLYGICIICLLIFVQGIIYPPNNWDSLTYHMARIPSWLAHRSLAPYPTHIIRQIYQPTFAEYMIMHAGVLSRSDVFSSSIQFFFYVFLLIAVAGAAKSIGLKRSHQLLAVFLCATLPEMVLQASSTQNDIVLCFFVISAWYFVLKAIKQATLSSYLFIGLSVGLAVMTKATSYIYLAPVLLCLIASVIIKLVREKAFQPLKYGVIAVLILVAINVPRILRNYEADGNLWGTTTEELSNYSNKDVSPAMVLSGIVKNAGLHLGVMGTKRVAKISNTVIAGLHNAAHININDPGNTYGKSTFSAPVFGVNHEDYAPNFLHFIMIAGAVIVLAISFFKGSRNSAVTVLFWIMFLQVALFCSYLRWQPWNTRLHLPMFTIGCILSVYAISASRIYRKALYVLVPVAFVYCICIILRNETRPYIDIDNGHISFTTISRPRYQNYFNNLPALYPEYAATAQQIHQNGFKNIGLILSANDFEYPVFNNCFSETINPVSILVHNYTRSCYAPITAVDCIVSTNTNKPFIDYNGRRYYNKDSGNKFIYLYQ